MVYFEDIEQKLSEKAKVIEEFTNKVRNIAKLAEKNEKINNVEEGKKEKSWKSNAQILGVRVMQSDTGSCSLIW
jgi:hypothetical protein